MLKWWPLFPLHVVFLPDPRTVSSTERRKWEPMGTHLADARKKGRGLGVCLLVRRQTSSSAARFLLSCPPQLLSKTHPAVPLSGGLAVTHRSKGAVAPTALRSRKRNLFAI